MRVPDIRFYTFDFVLLHVETFFISSNWSVYFNDVGTFEAHFELNSPVVELLTGNEYIVAVQGDMAAVITGVIAGQDFAVFGRTCNWILTKKVCKPPLTSPAKPVINTAEQHVKDIVQNAFAAANTNPLTYGDFAPLKSISFTLSDILPAFEQVKAVLDMGGGGHALTFDTENKCWKLSVFAFNDRTNADAGTAPLVVSEDNRNAFETEYVFDLLDRADGGYFNLPNANTSLPPTPTPVNVIAGVDPLKAWYVPLRGDTLEEAAQELSLQTDKKEITLKTVDLLLGKDYQLGDIVTVQVRKGGLRANMKKLVTGVNVWYEHNNCGEQPIFSEVPLFV